MRLLRLSSIFLLCTILLSCSIQKTATSLTAKIITDGMKALETESDLWIADQSVVPMVKIIEVLKEGDPDNREFLGLMPQVYGNIAFGFFEPKYLIAQVEERDVWRQRVERYYRLGSESGTKFLSKRFGKGADGSIMDFEKEIKKAKRRDLKALFWTAFDLGNLVNLNRDDVVSVANMPKVNIMIDKVLEIDPQFGYGSALAFKAAMLASRPKMLGGDPDKAAVLFNEAIKMHDGKYLMTKVMYAEWFAIPQGDAGLTRKLLTEVIDAGPNILPEQALANQIAKERARILLKKCKG